jgi:hypothetical protein
MLLVHRMKMGRCGHHMLLWLWIRLGRGNYVMIRLQLLLLVLRRSGPVQRHLGLLILRVQASLRCDRRSENRSSRTATTVF